LTTVITYGTFDLFHLGHVRLLERLKSLGTRLVVGCSSDEFNEIKGKKTIYPYEQRREILLSCKYVDKVFKEECWDQKVKDIKREGANIFAMGDDWLGKFDELNALCKVIYLPRTPNISTTDLKDIITVMHKDRKNELKLLVERMLTLVERM
jgi:glycerol-3-phosphate cytidylyltransferase